MKKGFTFIELIIVLAVLAVIVAVIIPQFSKNREIQVLKSAVGDTMSAIAKAQSETLSSVSSSSYGVHFESSQVIIFTGTSYVSNDPANEIILITSPAAITNVTLGGVSGSSGEIYFNRLSGTPSKTGTITISTTSFTKTITIGATGTVSSN